MTRLFLFDGVRCGCQCYWIYHTPAMIMYIFQMNKISLTSDSDYIVHKESLGISFFFVHFNDTVQQRKRVSLEEKKKKHVFHTENQIHGNFLCMCFHFILLYIGLGSFKVLMCLRVCARAIHCFTETIFM